MSWLFVSAARFRDAQAQIERLEQERQLLINRYLGANGLKPLYETPATAAAVAASSDPLARVEVAVDRPAREDKTDDAPRPRMRATFEQVEAAANADARDGKVQEWASSRRQRAAF
jgi:hypothetical protein